MKLIAAILAAALVFAPHAEAKTRHHHAKRHHYSATVKFSFNVRVGSTPPFVHGRLICAINTSRWLKAHGMRHLQTWSSRAYLTFPHVSRSSARFGDVRFNFRKGGGHVQPYLGGGMCLNPSSRHGWVRKSCPAGGIYLRTSR